MKIKLAGTVDPLILKEIHVINQGFTHEISIVNEEEDFVFYIDDGVSDKYSILRAYLLFLEVKTSLIQPWGLLNGMRPNKLVHSQKKHGKTNEQLHDYLKKTYLVTDEKINLLLHTMSVQLKKVPDLYDLEKEISLYVGIPFCPTRCTYCSFAAYATGPNNRWIAPFLEALYNEIRLVGQHLKEKKIKITSLYVGGGTPTSLDEVQLDQLMKTLKTNLPSFEHIREITVEAGRADTISKEKLYILKSYGTHRISINPQTFHQETLNKIGRHHLVADVFSSFKVARQMGFDNINMDLIVGLPEEGVTHLEASLKQIQDLAPESLTVHMLAYKKKSALTRELGLKTSTDEIVLNQMAQLTYAFSTQEGYVPYYLYRQKNISANLENIGYAKPGYECLYNILMMEEAQNILGLGVGASSKFLIGDSVHNPKDIKTYIDHVEDYVLRKLSLLDRSLEDDIKSFTYNP